MNVYDFDETIYAGESCVDFALFFFKKDPSLVKYIPEIVKSYTLYKREKIDFNYFIDNFAAFFEEYLSARSLDFPEIMCEFWDEKRIRNKIRPFYKKLQRPDDVVITASPEFLVKDACRLLGISRVIATQFDVETGKIGSPCFRESKIARFRESCGDAVIDDFYTDSMNDRFLMPYASRVFMVKGNRITRIK